MGKIKKISNGFPNIINNPELLKVAQKFGMNQGKIDLDVLIETIENENESILLSLSDCKALRDYIDLKESELKISVDLTNTYTDDSSISSLLDHTVEDIDLLQEINLRKSKLHIILESGISNLRIEWIEKEYPEIRIKDLLKNGQCDILVKMEKGYYHLCQFLKDGFIKSIMPNNVIKLLINDEEKHENEEKILNQQEFSNMVKKSQQMDKIDAWPSSQLSDAMYDVVMKNEIYLERINYLDLDKMFRLFLEPYIKEQDKNYKLNIVGNEQNGNSSLESFVEMHLESFMEIVPNLNIQQKILLLLTKNKLRNLTVEEVKSLVDAGIKFDFPDGIILNTEDDYNGMLQKILTLVEQYGYQPKKVTFNTEYIKDVPDLEKFNFITSIGIGEGENRYEENLSIEKYKLIREKLEEITRDIPKEANEEDKFKIVYARLANMIVYDDEAASDEPEYQEYVKAQKYKCRNLENGLLLGKCVCAGYAEILRQALSLVDIEAHYVCSQEHAYNQVKINNQWYNADLTWDYESLRRGYRPQYCLKSDEEFTIFEEESVYHTPKTGTTAHKCEKSIEIYGNRKEMLLLVVAKNLKRVTSAIKNGFRIKGKEELLPPSKSVEEMEKRKKEFDARIKIGIIPRVSIEERGTDEQVEKNTPTKKYLEDNVK